MDEERRNLLEKRKQRQFAIAIFATVASICGGLVLLSVFKPIMILVTVLLVSSTILQWIIYYSVCVNYEVVEAVRTLNDEFERVAEARAE